MNLLTISDIQRIIDDSLQMKDILNVDFGGNKPNYYRFFYRLALATQPDLIVELGSLHGGSAAHFAEGASWNTRVFGIDWNPNLKPFVHYPNLEFWQMDTRLASQRVKDIGMPIDILFIDSTHEAKHALEEFNLYYPLMRQGGILLADDIYFADMMDFWNVVPEPKFTDDRLNSPISGFGIAIKQ